VHGAAAADDRRDRVVRRRPGRLVARQRPHGGPIQCRPRHRPAALRRQGQDLRAIQPTTTNVHTHTHTHTHLFNGPLSGTITVSQYQRGKTNLDFTEARDSEWQWHQIGHIQVCTSLQTDSHASTPPLSFLQAGCPSCRPTNAVVKALKTDDECTSYCYS